MMRAPRWTRCLLVLLFPVTTAGQAPAVDSACTYDRCALWIDGGAVRRGAVGTVVLRDGFFRPMRLAAYVGDADSSGIWASRFEQRDGTGQTLVVAGLISMALGFGSHYLRARHVVLGSDDANSLEAVAIVGGYLAFFGGDFVRSTARPYRARAIWWYNRRCAATRTP